MLLPLHFLFFYLCNMPVKDYFQTLGIAPGASTAQIKKAFRTLAMRYHPDKLNDAVSDHSTFREIQEAYETLTDPIKRERYLYERWLSQSMGQSMDHTLLPEEILNLFINTEQYLYQTDKFRLNAYALFNQMTFIFDKNRIRTVIHSNNPTLIESCNTTALRIASLMNSETQSMFKDLLKELIGDDTMISNKWDTLIQKTNKKEKQETYKTILILIISLLICFIFYILSK